MATFTLWCNIERITIGRHLAIVAVVPYPDQPGAKLDLHHASCASREEAIAWCTSTTRRLQAEIEARGESVHRTDMVA